MKQFLVLPFLYYLRFFARLQLKKVSFLQKLKRDIFITIGITASAGKTTTAQVVYSALSSFYRVKLHTRPSETGLPLDILNITTKDYSLLDWLSVLFLCPFRLLTDWHTYQIFIAEMGIDSPRWPKNMDFLLSILNPDIAVFLNVNPVHAQSFNQPSLKLALKAIANEKAKLVNLFKPNKICIVNFQDTFVKASIRTKNKLLITKQDCHIKLKNYIFPKSFSHSLSTAYIIAKHLGLKTRQVTKSIQSNFSPPPGRSTLLQGIKNTTIIDSSYNSSPQAALEMLDILSSFSTKKIAVLGDMRELGLQTKISHQKLYKQAQKSADLIIGVGSYTQKYFKKSPKVHTFQFWWQALDFLKNQIKGGEIILVKGSQNTIYLEELIKALLKNKSDSKELCRQFPYWLSLKQKFKLQNLV